MDEDPRDQSNDPVDQATSFVKSLLWTFSSWQRFLATIVLLGILFGVSYALWVHWGRH